MAKYKRARKVNYFIKRIKKDDEMQYWLYTDERPMELILKLRDGWYAKTRFHQTLRDAIIYCLYGV